ncbi:hypothetical protein DRQ21_07025 [Candidatus Fermentibacteria bacterium]|nr:MAG: hypothetical protein DRQ21_07025 [Candidatus Fermentibacteria bacterium]
MKYLFKTVLIISILSASAAAETCSLIPAADTWIWSGTGPWGSSWTLRTNIVSLFDQEIVIRFNLSSIPSGSTINSADLFVNRYDGSSQCDSMVCEIYRVTEDWEEATLVDSIAHDSSYHYDQIAITCNGWYSMNLTGLVQEWIDGTYINYGAVFYGIAGTGSYQYFRSRESSSDKPHLDINYTPPSMLEHTTFASIKATFTM